MKLVTKQSTLTAAEDSSEFLGGKGWGLHWMASNGVNVPPFVIIPTHVCRDFMKDPVSAMLEVKNALPAIKAELYKAFGYMPLMSVRSGARVSMPGMMDTILNVGLDTDSMAYWHDRLGGKCYDDSRDRLVTMYGSVVKGLNRQELEAGGVEYYIRKTGEGFPAADAQLFNSIIAVFESWNNDRAQFYRKMHKIPDDWGTAVVIQAMVFGNLNEQSGTGVLFTRNPDTGEKKITGEFLVNAQGEDVVAGIRTPIPLAAMNSWNAPVATQLADTVVTLEDLKRDVQDVEFTIQDGELFILQTRNAKRSAKAALKIALDMYEEGMLAPQEVFQRVSLRDYDLAQVAVIDPKFTVKPEMQGIPACSGVVSGKPVFSSADAINCKESCILVTYETTPEDIQGMDAAVGVLTITGGATSHAAVVARGMNKPCVVGLGGENTLDLLKKCQTVSIDGGTGGVWTQAVPVIAGGGGKYAQEYRILAVSGEGVAPAVTRVLPGVEVQLLDLRSKAFNAKEAFDLITEALPLVSRLYVDVSGKGDPMSLIFGEPLELLGLINELSVADRKKLTLIGVSVVGVGTVGTSTDLESMILAEGGLVVGVEGTLSAAQKKVFAWKAQEGVQGMALGSKVDGALSFISPEYAVQLKGGHK